MPLPVHCLRAPDHVRCAEAFKSGGVVDPNAIAARRSWPRGAAMQPGRTWLQSVGAWQTALLNSRRHHRRPVAVGPATPSGAPAAGAVRPAALGAGVRRACA
eukprot:365823-Chlamydomonas_euryale.AAC.5